MNPPLLEQLFSKNSPDQFQIFTSQYMQQISSQFHPQFFSNESRQQLLGKKQTNSTTQAAKMQNVFGYTYFVLIILLRLQERRYRVKGELKIWKYSHQQFCKFQSMQSSQCPLAYIPIDSDLNRLLFSTVFAVRLAILATSKHFISPKLSQPYSFKTIIFDLSIIFLAYDYIHSTALQTESFICLLISSVNLISISFFFLSSYSLNAIEFTAKIFFHFSVLEKLLASPDTLHLVLAFFFIEFTATIYIISHLHDTQKNYNPQTPFLGLFLTCLFGFSCPLQKLPNSSSPLSSRSILTLNPLFLIFSEVQGIASFNMILFGSIFFSDFSRSQSLLFFICLPILALNITYQIKYFLNGPYLIYHSIDLSQETLPSVTSKSLQFFHSFVFTHFNLAKAESFFKTFKSQYPSCYFEIIIKSHTSYGITESLRFFQINQIFSNSPSKFEYQLQAITSEISKFLVACYLSSSLIVSTNSLRLMNLDNIRFLVDNPSLFLNNYAYKNNSYCMGIYMDFIQRYQQQLRSAALNVHLFKECIAEYLPLNPAVVVYDLFEVV